MIQNQKLCRDLRKMMKKSYRKNRLQEIYCEQDNMLERANDGLDALKRKAEMMGETLDKHEKDLHELGHQIDKATEGVNTANARLKQVLLTVSF